MDGILGGGGGGMGPMGALGMDFGMHELPIVGGLFRNPQEEFKAQQMNVAGRTMAAYRPEQAQARLNALRQASGAMQPMNNALASMYGAGATQGANPQNPMSPRMMEMGTAGQGSDPRGPATGGFNMGGMGGMGGMLGGLGGTILGM